MNDLIVPIIIAVLGGGTLGTIISTYMNRTKIFAEAQNINIKGELAISQAAMDFASSLRDEIRDLRNQLSGLEGKHVDLQGRFDSLLEENRGLRTELAEMRSRNAALEALIEKCNRHHDTP